MKNVIITGATSGIGKELAIQFALKGNKVGLIGRRIELLKELKEHIGDLAYFRALDVTDFEQAEKVYASLIEEMGGMDVFILNAGIGRDSRKLTWLSDKQTIDINVLGFAHGMNVGLQYFIDNKKSGQIVGMSSIASNLASGRAAAYTATKHFISNYMTGFRQKVNRMNLDVVITDVKPGYVISEMTANNKAMFWVSSTEKAVSQMIKGIEKKKRHLYVTKRWRFMAWIAKLVPQFVWDRLRF